MGKFALIETSLGNFMLAQIRVIHCISVEHKNAKLTPLHTLVRKTNINLTKWNKYRIQKCKK